MNGDGGGLLRRRQPAAGQNPFFDFNFAIGRQASSFMSGKINLGGERWRCLPEKGEEFTGVDRW